MSNDHKPYQTDRLNRPFEGRWSERSGDSRVAYVETQRELRADCPNESLALKRAEGLVAKARNTDSQRMILAWLGIIHDRLGQYAAAADAISPPPHTPQPPDTSG